MTESLERLLETAYEENVRLDRQLAIERAEWFALRERIKAWAEATEADAAEMGRRGNHTGLVVGLLKAQGARDVLLLMQTKRREAEE